ncbi:MAG: thioesterase family protein [Candidatus Obscuribacterales bacterium]|nr:thioesterase family protein [Steroidobacteraceae bacterium]
MSIKSNEAFFQRQGSAFIPTSASAGPWNPRLLHGRVIAGLLAFQIEENHSDPDMLPARLTVDMYRAPDFSPIEIATRIVRDGHRIKVIDADFLSNGVSMARASCQMLRKTSNPPGIIWQPPSWDVPLPDAVSAPHDAPNSSWEIRGITGAFGSAAQRRVWMRELRSLVEGVPLTPWMRAALIADFASPCAHAGDQGLRYINTDLTQYLHRLPSSDWIGMETINHRSTDGIAVGECFVYDAQGPIGSTSVVALAQKTTPQ